MQFSWRSIPGQPGRRATGYWPPTAAASLCGLVGAGLGAWWTLRLLGRQDILTAAQEYGSLSGAGLRAGRFWQPLTYLFLPGSTRWLLCVNGPLLFLAGRHLERIVGRRHLLALFFLTGAAGGLAQAAYNFWVEPPQADTVLAGITAPTVGVFAALAGIVPELELVPPLALSTGSHGPAWLRIKHGAVGVLVLLGAALVVDPAGEFAAQEAVRGLVGGLTGCLCVRQLGFGRRRRAAQAADPNHAAEFAAAEAAAEAVSGWSNEEPHPTAVAAPVAAAAGALVVPRWTERERRMSAREYITEQIDPILDKISRHGLGSLTDVERRVLEKGRDKITAAAKAAE